MLDINIHGVMKKSKQSRRNCRLLKITVQGAQSQRGRASSRGQCLLLRKWIAAYQALGAAGLRSKKKKNYNPEFKLNVWQRMREEELSHRQVAALFDIRKSDIIGEWERRYDEGGLEALSRQPGSGRHKKRTEPIPFIQLESSGDEARTRDDLLAELSQLRMEIAYLKKLDALVQAKERATQRNKRKS